MGKRKRNKRKKAKAFSVTQGKKNNGHTLSVCLITKNEAERIESAIRSVLPFADEVVVVDTGSTDDTVEIAKRLGAKIGYFEWCDDFSAARNVSLDLATGDWIMWLDADDIIPASEWSKLRELKKTSLDKAFLFKLKNKGTTASVFWQMRMFPNRPEIRFKYPVHEQVSPAIMELRIPMLNVDITVVHTGYISPEVTRTKIARNTRLLKKYLKKHPDDSFCRLYLGRSYMSEGDLKNAVKELELAVANNEFKKHSSATYIIALITLGDAYMRLGRTIEAKKVLEQANLMDPQSANTIVPLAECYNRLEMPEKAWELLRELNDIHFEPSMMPTDPSVIKFTAELQKAAAMAKLGMLRDAFISCRKAEAILGRQSEASVLARALLPKLSRDKKDLEFLEHFCQSELACADDFYELGNAFVRTGDIDKALKAYEGALKKDHHPNSIRALALIWRRRGQMDKAKELLEEGVSISPNDQGLVCDLADLLFDMEDWKGIIDLPYSDVILPTRLAARILGGFDKNIEKDIFLFFRTLNGDISKLDTEGVKAIWELGKGLQNPQRFHLAVTCSNIDPALIDAVENAVDGFLNRGQADKAIKVAESYLSAQPSDPKGFEMLARCYEKKGANEAAKLCIAHLQSLNSQASSREP